MKSTTRNRKWIALIVALMALVFCVTLAPSANAAEATQATYTIQQTDEGVQVLLNNATFRKNADGSVAILDSDGNQVDSLSATYQGVGIEYRLVTSSQLIATKGKAAGGSQFRGYRSAAFDGGKYAGCIAWNTLKAGATGAIGTALTGPGAAAGLLTGLVGGLVVNPIECLRN